ncbi:flagellar basal body P-ring formation chaperone FlgA [Arhodomonas aquaeolei]|uniref:flagellar basal body P-ring formation chaperone FlgA n=1 Tax=Arhodomonas aquaeolei TaxID=2369 RepID=UPI000371B5B0|nr:flagellar basal body P-ring formation chaperone FlgA [Arhodomonas aquaeolei]
MAYRAIVALILLGSVLPAAQARPTQSLAEIRTSVQAFVNELDGDAGQLERVEIDRLDERLRLPACGEALAADAPNRREGSERLVVRVRCPGPSPWKVYVPTRVVRSIEVVVAARPVPRGSRLDAEDLRTARRTTTRLRGEYYTDPEGLIGLQTQRSLQPGTVIDAGQLTRPTLVRRGDTLLIQAGNGPVKVSMQGRALEDGTRGERIRARNLSSERVVEGEVVARGRMRVNY